MNNINSLSLINNKDDLDSRLKEIPLSPGCYLMRDLEEDIIYIGKSKSLRTRVKSYFRNFNDLSPRINLMVRQIYKIDIIVTDNESEALNLESNLIKTHKPYFNILLKDDKKYPYVCITWSEKYPRIFITRKRSSRNKYDRYYGPYVDVGLLRKTLDLIRKTFPLRQRSIPLYKDRTCINYSIERCPGVCQEIISPEEYIKIIKRVSLIFQGRNEELKSILKKNMNNYSLKQEYEKAGIIRDNIRGLDNLIECQKVSIPNSNINRDIFGIASSDKTACVQIFQMRSGKLVGRIAYTHKNIIDDKNILQRILEEHYSNVDSCEIPSEILLQYVLPKQNYIQTWLSEIRKRKVKILVPKRSEKFQLVELVKKNASLEINVINKDLHDNLLALEDLTQMLELNNNPQRIEGYDISHVSGSDAVGSQVVFIDGIPAKQHYRKYKIRNESIITGYSDDYESIREVINRRFKKWAKIKKEGYSIDEISNISRSNLDNNMLNDWPNLIMIDGGKGQLNAAFEELRKLDLHQEINICSLAKRNESVFVINSSKPINKNENQIGVKLLRRIRDEAHRFALNYHKQKRSLRMTRSQLNEIPGLGKIKIRDLLDSFKSIEAIRFASKEELIAVKGIGDSIAIDIYNYFNNIE
tara:strand:+ start:22407 stop:24329 length:1923 start_codon:yes stop_codon:yes gene_type:complete